MSYEKNMLEKLAMPAKQEVKKAIIKTLFTHNGCIKEFTSGESIVSEIADLFSLNNEQRKATLERIYRKENRIVKTPLWHRLLYRSAEELAKEHYITRPGDTFTITKKREWLLTEKGIDYALKLLNLLPAKKESFLIPSAEILKEIKLIKETAYPQDYIPFETTQKLKISKKIENIRLRSFRQVIIESYEFSCCVCGLKIYSPNNLSWEVEAAHIVPHSFKGKDDIWNGIALCHLHHWAFDAGWFSLSNNYRIVTSSLFNSLPDDFGKNGKFSFFKNSLDFNKMIALPKHNALRPHENAIKWHREHIFYQ